MKIIHFSARAVLCTGVSLTVAATAAQSQGASGVVQASDGVAFAQPGDNELRTKWGILADLAGEDFALCTKGSKSFCPAVVAARWEQLGRVLVVNRWGGGIRWTYTIRRDPADGTLSFTGNGIRRNRPVSTGAGGEVTFDFGSGLLGGAGFEKWRSAAEGGWEIESGRAGSKGYKVVETVLLRPVTEAPDVQKLLAKLIRKGELLAAAERQPHQSALAAAAPVKGVPGAVWADRNNDGVADGYVHNGQYYLGAPATFAPPKLAAAKSTSDRVSSADEVTSELSALRQQLSEAEAAGVAEEVLRGFRDLIRQLENEQSGTKK